MKEILITSSVLIAALLLLRRVFRRSISRRAQYALWALVLLRLLVPVNLPAIEHNVLTAAEPVQTVVIQRLEQPQLYSTPVDVSPAAAFPEARNVQPGQLVPTAQSFGYPVLSDDGTTVTTYANRLDRPIILAEILAVIWYGGMAGMALWFLLSNLLFWQKLQKSRTPYPVENCPRQVYLVEEGLPSPCLFGLFRPAVYLTPAAVASPEALRHVLAHEETHARHLDPLWSLLRAVCLTVYWFDPLVWAAAITSRNDCELACDEGAILRLGEAERIPYGKTLLSLIPVGRGPANPLLSATTMTAGKKQLKDRVTRIAECRRTVGLALFAVLTMAALVCAATFTGAASRVPEDGGSPAGSAPRADGPLTGDELRYFNLDFFNGTDVYGGDVFNIRNQFLAFPYERPEDMDLFTLFYQGTGLPTSQPTAAERQALSEALGFGIDTDVTKNPAADIENVLLENTGLTLDGIGREKLENFTCLPEYDAYYNIHGDTTYIGSVEIASGEREGALVRLYYEDRYYGDGWKCVTLRELEDSGYHFVSNLPCETPAIPTVYPAEAPWMTVPLTDLPDHGWEVIPRNRHSMDCARRGGGYTVKGGYATDGRSTELTFRPYRSTDGNFYAAIIRDEAMGPDGPAVWEADVFLTMSPINSLEWDGITIRFQYVGALGGRYIYELSYLDEEDGYPVTVYDYYCFYEDGTAVRVHRTRCYENRFFDLNGDGAKELVCVGRDGAEILFEDPDRPGVIHLVDVGKTLKLNWPDLAPNHVVSWDYAQLDTFDRCLRVRGLVDMPEWGDDARADFQRAIYFTPENLLVYTNLTDTRDHMAANISASIPEAVRADALAMAENAYAQVRSGADAQAARYDDWRVSALSLTGVYTDLPAEGTLEVYGADWQLHAGNPAGVLPAGGMYVQEDGWMGGYYLDSSPYLLYLLRKDGSRERLTSLLERSYSTDSPFYRADLCRSVVQGGLADMADLEARDLFYMFYKNPHAFLNGLDSTAPFIQRGIFEKLTVYAEISPQGEASLLEDSLDALRRSPDGLTDAGRAACARLMEQSEAGGFFQELMDELLAEDTVLLELDTGGAPGGGTYEASTSDGSVPGTAEQIRGGFRWSRTEADRPSQGRSLQIRNLRDNCVLEFWEDSGLVRCSRRDQTVFYQTEPVDPEDSFTGSIFECMRIWFDEAEYDALSENIAIPDRGQSHLEIAQEWSRRTTAVNLRLTPGSIYACTFVRTTAHVEEWTDMPENSYPAYTEGMDRFWFGYTRAFVPENERSLSWQMAGNTGNYTGSDPDVPEGAFENFQVGCLYLAEDGWRCDGTGTGP